MTHHFSNVRLGARLTAPDVCAFLVWAPFARKVDVALTDPQPRQAALSAVGNGYHYGQLQGAGPGTRYQYRLFTGQAPDDVDPLVRPDPASRYQPDGVHGPSQVVADDFEWHDSLWRGLPLSHYIIYEAHVGLMSEEGTFDGMIARLDDLKELGITALELMPVAQFPGNRNWGYDGVYPFAAQSTYGGVDGLKRLVDACHQKGLAVILDVVYNHFGPEGNYLADFGPYFTDAYRTPWGAAVNFDGPHSADVRRYFIENALYWVIDVHIDALRLDAVHAIYDFSARPFLEELAIAVQTAAEQRNRTVLCIAESALNDTRIIRPRAVGGFNLDAQWNDDFHHALHVQLTGEHIGYYADFGRLEHLAKAWRDGYVYSGEYSAFHQRPHGNSSRSTPARQLVVFAQNHDQVGNRMLGERLDRQTSFERLKVAAATVLLSPFIPLLFMGEEYAEPAAFPYFVSHSDRDLVEAVRQGRRKEFEGFVWQGEPPDPQDEATFASARLDWELRRRSPTHAALCAFYQTLIRLRKTVPALKTLSKRRLHVATDEDHRLLFIRRWHANDEVALLLGFNAERVIAPVPFTAGIWRKCLDAAQEPWQGPGSPVPEVVIAQGPLKMEVPSFAVLLWQRSEQSGSDSKPERITP
ncbi:MAG: malto-oligosyltrehalose trehalohydrolase [Desulfatitalea sp. BRH_c12]|nr:MAG: malto-oligosyltrehalose trehalohydrolase [Desulfatitalea sp. BRH_c12]